jgi:hypothetical protein
MVLCILYEIAGPGSTAAFRSSRPEHSPILQALREDSTRKG